MKKYIYALSIILIFILNIEPVNGQNENFELKLTIYEKEVSKDSHADAYDIHITGRDVKYTGKHTGFKNEKEDKNNYQLSKATFKNLVAFILKNRLNRNLKEERATGKLGLSVSVLLKITMKSKTTVMKISGMYNDWMKKGKNKSNIKNLRYYHLASRILASIKLRSKYF